MHTQVFGEGRVVLLLHGTAPPETLVALARRLGESVRAVVCALPGYDGSEQIAPRRSEDVLDALEEQLADYPDATIDVVGHSGGAYFALALAARRPERVGRIALLAPAHHITEELRADLPEFAAAARAGKLRFADVITLWFSESYLAEHPERVRELAEPFERDIAALADDLETYATADDRREAFESLAQPVYVRSGTADVRTPPEAVEEIETLIDDVEVDWVDGAGHMVHIEDEDATVAALRDFFARGGAHD